MIEMVVGVVALLVGIALGWWLATTRWKASGQASDAQAQAALAQASAEAASSRAEAAQARESAARVQALQSSQLVEAAQGRERVAEAERKAAEATVEASRVGALLAGARAERDAAVRRAEELAADRQSMLDQFKVLSSETLTAHGKAADQAAEHRLRATEQVLRPVNETLTQLQARITEVEKSREAMSAELREQVRTITLTNESLRRETASLTTALRTPQVRGAWGEQSLKRIVELSGLVERCDFFQQASTRTEDGLFRPDLTIKLAGDKVIFVDSKVPLTALLDAYNTEDDAVRGEHLIRFAKLVRGHVDDLSKKNYWALDAGSPEFVVLFLPSEEIFRVALQEQPDLQEYAAGKQIVLASPSILIGLLKTVAHAWQQARLAESATEVQELGRELYRRLAKLGDHFAGVGRALTSATTAYNHAVGSLESRVLVTARKFSDLNVTNEPLPRVRPVGDAVRPLTAVELLDTPDELPLGEQAELRRALPRVEDLLDDAATPLPRTLQAADPV